ncbi:hypothetical protein AK830_g1525 [Neonectria ditissima]|uniref:Uncharacterized protein n=1 Tax=Neonectria ditissima TaxID=78410 RepID=A0A0P7BWS6_9HYPO|nr:hypothetical protein AK830_g1525 [Neonectria ditissima]
MSSQMPADTMSSCVAIRKSAPAPPETRTPPKPRDGPLVVPALPSAQPLPFLADEIAAEMGQGAQEEVTDAPQPSTSGSSKQAVSFLPD